MTNYVVTSNLDTSTGGTLRQYIGQAVDGDTITFDQSLQGSTITLGSTLTITHGITIDGDSRNITISGNNSNTVFTVNNTTSAATTTIENLAINNGSGVGGTGGTSFPGGNAAGGIFESAGSLRLINDSFSNNTARGGNGGVDNSGQGRGYNGGNAAGAVYVQGGTITAQNLMASNNTATAGMGLGGGTNGAADPISNNAIVRAAVVQPTPPANNAPCYCTGTHIHTAQGEVAVEDLRIGDTVVTASGQHRPIKWIGTRGYIGRFANANPAVLPVSVQAGALADGIPTRDLWVSPDHALFLDGLLVPVELLVNGVTITKASCVESVTYWHVELDSHDVLVAEGAAAESFVDDGDRAIFQNAVSYRVLYPDAAPAAAVYCAPRVADDGAHGYALEAIRRRIALRAGLPVPPARVFGALRGALEACDGRRVAGWAQDTAHPDGPVCLDVVVDGVVTALVYADDHRPDLAAASVGDGRHGFDLDLPEALDPAVPHVVEVRRSADGAAVGVLHVNARVDRAA